MRLLHDQLCILAAINVDPKPEILSRRLFRFESALELPILPPLCMLNYYRSRAGVGIVNEVRLRAPLYAGDCHHAFGDAHVPHRLNAIILWFFAGDPESLINGIGDKSPFVWLYRIY